MAIFPLTAFAQVCPNPAVVVGTACTVPPGTIITVTPANAIGLNASGALGQIVGGGITVNLAAAGTTGALAQAGATIIFNGSTLLTTATTTANSAGQVGLRANGTASTISSSGSAITIGPPNGTTTANNLTGAIAESGGILNLSNTPITMLGGANGVSNHGLVATAAGSQISYLGGTISTLSRGSFGVLAQNGGVVTLGNAAQVITTGAQNTAAQVGSHALFATGAGSQIVGTGIAISVSGLFASGARAESGGLVSLTGGTIASSSTAATDADPSSAARALSGGVLNLSGVTIDATGLRGVGFSVQDAGSQATVSGSTITVDGARAPAAFIFGGGQATVTNSTLISNNNHGVSVQDAGSTVTLTGTAITGSTSPSVIGYGLRVVTGGSATMIGGSTTTTARDSPGIYAAGGAVVATNVVVTTSGPDNAIGVLADGGGQITLNGGTVTTHGDAVRQASFPHALGARNPGGVLTSTNTTLLTTGITAMGAVADDGGTMILNGNSITTLGLRSIGLYSVTEQVGAQFPANLTASGVTVDTSGLFAHGAAAQARNDVPVEKATLTVNDSAITTHGEGAVGLRATLGDYGTRPITGRGEAAVIANRSNVFTEGIGAHGALSRDNPTSVTMNDTVVLATGAIAHGSVAQAGGLIVGNNTRVTAIGAEASALLVVGEGGPVSNAIFANSLLRNVSGPTIGVAGAGNVSLTGTVAGGSGQWLRVGTIDNFPLLAAPEPPLTGIPDPIGPDDPLPPPMGPFPPPAAPGAMPGLANVLLDGSTVTGSAFTAVGSVSNVRMLNDSLWIMTGNSNLTNLLNDPSLIQYTPPTGDPTQLASYKTLTVVNYVGEGGQIGLNTYLGADGAPSDMLVINGGTTTGDTTLIVKNTTGPGALTVANGILVVDTINGATSESTAFTLAGDYITKDGQPAVVGGAYAYTLHFNGVGADSGDQNWYLRSLAIPNPPGPVPPVPPKPRYQPGVPIYEVYPQNLLALAAVPTMQQRVGNRYWTEPAPAPETVFCKDASQNFQCPVTGAQAQYYAGAAVG
ncbi:autotransporter outer membrane beta-barrel domain-containing protein, partial [Aminobacter sp. AP02]|uniref:autotransporter outer membrane beta-barrel domain-containing protein n=1 Tax=Aminobacter sp. AP02 TaxID=2135737 RepID=UPI000D6D36EF